MTQAVASTYDRFYGRGGWRYDHARERAFLRRRIVRPARWRPGQRVLELGCGRGDHAKLLSTFGLSVTAVDLSAVGIERAQKRFGNDNPRFFASDVTTFVPDERDFDGIFVRGLSLYHYELSGQNKHGHDVAAVTARFFEWLRPGGRFVLQIATDFSGRRPKNRVHFSKRSAYVNLFRPFGRVLSTTDWRGRKLINDVQARKAGKKGIILVCRKSTG